MAGSSLGTNPPNADRHLTSGGSDWLWAVFAIMALSTLGMVVWSFMRPRGTRLFHNIATVILMTATIAYFSMASDLGATPVRAEFGRGTTNTRQIFFVRYIQWFITFPLILIMLLFTSGLSLSDILTTAFFAWVVVVTGLVGALTPSTYKWGYFVMGIAALCYIWTHLLFHGPRSNFNGGTGVRSGFVRGAGMVAFLTMLYPIAWGISEGGNVISVTGEMIFYGILDLLLGPIFLYYFVWGIRNVDYGLFGLHGGRHGGNTGAGYGNNSGTGGVSGAGYGNGAGAGTGTVGTHGLGGNTGGAVGTGGLTSGTTGTTRTTGTAGHTKMEGSSIV
ncbi:hypothetical protein BC835DRAFT_1537054 [Cytidiella melzeri]|nr:hypothetical protein BC835DRAFT_1537054 [Cytidiella melzeri]